jgi:hypothetical protein
MSEDSSNKANVEAPVEEVSSIKQQVLKGKKRKLRRRERNHAKREERVKERPAVPPPMDGRPETAHEDLSAEDIMAVSSQLGFAPTNLIKVVARENGKPSVVQVHEHLLFYHLLLLHTNVLLPLSMGCYQMPAFHFFLS